MAIPVNIEDLLHKRKIEIPCRDGFVETAESINEPLNESLNEPLNNKELLVLSEISKKQQVNRKQLTEATGISAATMTRIISILSSEPLNLIERKGSKKDGGYVLTEKGITFLGQL